jgi:predicted transposase/invertase (TIGR01784 family)
MTTAPHDSFFRGSMQYTPIAAAFLTAHLPQEILARIALNTLTIESGSFVDEEHKAQITDILYSAQIDQEQGFLCFLIEHQSRAEALMPFCLLCYQCAILDAHIKQQPKPPKKLPVILPIVMYNGKKSPYPGSTDLCDCFMPRDLAEKNFLKPFRLLDLTVIPDETLQQHQAAAVMELLEKHIYTREIMPLIQKLIDAQLFVHVRDIGNGKYDELSIKYMLTNSESNDTRKAVKLLIQALPDKEEKIMTIAEQLKKQGREEGSEERAIKIAKELRIRGMNIQAIADITKLPNKVIKTL